MMTVTFNLPDPHTHAQRERGPQHQFQHPWHYNMSSAPQPACLITILSAGDPRGNKSRAGDLTDLLLPRGAAFSPFFFYFHFSPQCICTQSAAAATAAVPSHRAQAQAASCRALFNDFRFIFSPPPCVKVWPPSKRSKGERWTGSEISMPGCRFARGGVHMY